MCKEVQVGAGVVKKSGGVQSMRGPSDFKSFFLIDGKLISRLLVITPDVIVNKGGPGAEKSSVQGKEAPVAGGGACQRGQPAHLASHHHHAHCQVACGNYHRECCEKGQEQYPNL